MGWRRWSTRWRVVGLRWPYHRLHQQALLGWPVVERQGCWSMLASGDSAANGFGSRSFSRVAVDLAGRGALRVSGSITARSLSLRMPARCFEEVDTVPLLTRIAAPVLLLSGDNSPIASAQHSTRLAMRSGCDAASSSPMIPPDDSSTQCTRRACFEPVPEEKSLT